MSPVGAPAGTQWRPQAAAPVAARAGSAAPSAGVPLVVRLIALGAAQPGAGSAGEQDARLQALGEAARQHSAGLPVLWLGVGRRAATPRSRVPFRWDEHPDSIGQGGLRPFKGTFAR